MPEYVDDPNLNSRKENRETEEAEAIKISNDAKAFLIGRTQEYVTVPIAFEGTVQGIEIRARLSRKEARRFQPMFDIWEAALAGDNDAFEGHDNTIAEFLEYITKDKSLNFDFWMMPELDEDIIRTVLLTYFTQPAANMARIWKFRRK